MKCEARGMASSHLCAFSQLLSSAARAWRFVDMAAHSRMACTGRGEGERRYGVLRVGRVEYLRHFFFLSSFQDQGGLAVWGLELSPRATARPVLTPPVGGQKNSRESSKCVVLVYLLQSYVFLFCHQCRRRWFCLGKGKGRPITFC